ncbi:phage tail protein [Burkholderia cepacia]|uniref:Tail tip fiber protein gp19 n=1 Tax=Burkholderia cepacia GG4 TaxID=1009846 RepID=A0A9W3PBE2_BURCE|nr:phage tail protein [Burkholderia cepacia]AFQ50455.1 tail tip fiber protein gp19 [Burkholderia cepacia GG4]
MRKLYAESGLKRISGAKGGGGGGGGGGESPDSLHSVALAKVLDIITEGEAVGLVKGMQSVFLDGTPIQNSDGSVNFQNYSVDVRTGTPDQDFMPGFPAVEREAAVGVPLTSDAPWVRQVQNTQLTAVRIRFGVPALQKSDPASGVFGCRVEYAIDLSVDGGSYAQVLSAAFDGKTTSLYERSHRIELPRAKTGWLVRVRRITPNAHSSLIADAVNIEAITEVVDRKLRYPMTALVGMTFDARSFSQVPVRSYHVRGLIVRVPSNYAPETRAYSGTWDGTFKLAWTNNPAWIFYDLLLSERYGLGKSVDASMIDKWGLYEIARYCDVMVSDGKGGVEPRFTCNCVIQSAADAFKVLQDIASVFRGIAYWGPGAVVASADMPSDPAYVYTAANVVGGAFRYVGSERKTRYTVALVSYNDPTNQYKQAVEYVPDEDGIARHGVVKTQVTAFGCTSQAQAHRLGRWILLTSRYESGTVSFQVGMDGVLVGPGQVIAIADPKKAGRRIGGRVRSAAGAVVALDKAPTVAAGDRFTAILPSGVAQSRAVKSVSGDVLTLVDRFDADPVSGGVWMVESSELAAQLYRVVSVQESDDDGQIAYTITATMHEPGKYAAIDDGAQIQQRPPTIIPPSVQASPTNVQISTYSAIDQGISKTTMVIAWDAADNAVTYLPEWRKDNGEWVTVAQTGGLQVEVPGIYQGRYVARVRAQNVMGVTSLPAVSAETQLTGKTSLPPAVVSLKAAGVVYGINLDWAFPSDGSAGDTQRTEIWQSRTPNRADAIKFSDFAYPQAFTSIQGLAVGQVFYYWARLVDTTGNIGPWFPATGPGVQGQPTTDQSAYEKFFEGQISHSALGEDLKKPIDAIPGIQHGVADNAKAIAKEVTDRAAAVAGEAQARADAVSAESRDRADAIAKEVKDRTDAIAKEATDRANAVADEARQRGAAVTAEQQTRQTADDSLGKRIDTVTASVGDASAAIKAEETARVGADGALSTRIDTVVAKSNDNAAAISSEATTRAGADTALGKRVDAVVVDVGVNKAAITAEQQARADADGALSTRIDTVVAKSNDNAAAISSEATTRAGADTALGKRVDAVTVDVGNNKAAITTEQQARADADGALGKRVDAVTATANANAAAITQEQTARADGDAANAGTIAVVQAQTNAKNSTFRQSVMPIAKAINDVWIDLGSANLFKQSQAFAAASAWGRNSLVTSVVDNAVIAPDGTKTAATLSVSGQGYIYQGSSMVAGERYTQSIFAQAGTATQIAVQSFQQTGVQYFDLAAGKVGTTSGIATNPQIVAIGGGWYRCSVTWAPTSTGANNVGYNIPLTGAGAVNIWGAQLEKLTGTGRYIPTATDIVSTAGNNTMLVWDGGVWVPSQDARIANNAAAISTEADARVTADNALSNRIDTVTASAAVNSAAITTEQKARADADGALSTRIDSLSSTVGGNAAAITAEQTARSDADSALGKRIDTISATVGQNTANITAEKQARADCDSALSNRIESVSAQINVPMAGDTGQAAGSTKVMAGVYSEQTARAEADMALAQRLDSVTAQMENDQASLIADIRTESEARVDAISAHAEQITTVRVQANANAAAVETVAQSYADLNGRVSASYQIKTQVTTDGRTYIAGIGIGIDNSGGIVESQVLVSASRFAVVDPNNGGSSIVPFVVQGGQVFLRQALIGAGWITNAMIGSYIQSDNYIAGRQGWRLDKSGWFEINASDGSGNRLVVDGSSVRVYDGNGVLRVRMGMW